MTAHRFEGVSCKRTNIRLGFSRMTVFTFVFRLYFSLPDDYFAPKDGFSLFLYDLIRFGLTLNPDPQLKEEKEVFSQNINMKFGKFPSTLIVTFWNTKRRSRVNNSNKKSQL